jgi:hypothetical protein
MPVKDRIVSWFIQNVIVPKREIIDRPGFVITTFTDQNVTTYLRDLFLPEKLFETIENKIVQYYGEEGKQVLYSAGKKNGFLYASISNFPSINDSSENEISNFAYLLVRYIETMFAKQADHDINLEKKTFSISFKDYIICSKNGLGYIMTSGGIAGIWAYAMQDKEIEGIQLECQGKNNDKCVVICEPSCMIQGRSNEIFYEKNLPDYKFDDDYKIMNEIRQTTYSHNSLKNLIDAGFFNYEQGILSYKNNRFFGCESHILYLLEGEISKLVNGEQTLFDICFDYGKKLRETCGENEYQRFISDFFPALGFGDLTVTDPEKITISAIYYPWTIYSEKSKYIIFRGVLSGFISSALEKEIKLNNFDIDINNYLTLTINPE